MKKIFKASFVLLFFSMSIFIFNMSCKKESTAQTNTTNVTPQNLGILIFSKNGDKTNEFWTSKYDGTSQLKVTISSFPADGDIDGSSWRISPDGKKVFFLLYTPSSQVQSLYSCNIDGSGLTKLIENVDELNGAL